MSGEEFLETLKKLGYPKADSLDPQSFDWLFEDTAAVTLFLEWFCQNLNSANILKPDQLNKFKEFEETTGDVLEGRQLEVVLDLLPDSEDDVISTEAFKKEISLLTEEVGRYLTHKEMLIHRRNQLDHHLMKWKDRLSNLPLLITETKYQKISKKSSQDNEKMESALVELVESVSDLSSLYSQSFSNSSFQTSDIPFFPSQVPLNDYFTAEESYIEEIKAFTKKQFFEFVETQKCPYCINSSQGLTCEHFCWRLTRQKSEGISEMAVSSSGDGRADASGCDILEVTSPEGLLIGGSTDSEYKKECKEIKRLQQAFVQSEMLCISAAMDLQRATAARDYMEEVTQTVEKETLFSNDSSLLKQRIQENNEALHKLQTDLKNWSENELQELVEENAASRVTKILTGNCDLKISRQDYFMSNQEQLINYLAVQQSRILIVSLMFEVESQTHHNIHQLLSTIQSELEHHRDNWISRMKIMDNTALTPARHQLSSLNSKMQFLQLLNRMIGGENVSNQMFTTHSSLIDAVKQLSARHDKVVEKWTSANLIHKDEQKTLNDGIKKCKCLLYANSSATSGCPPLFPLPLIETRNKLISVLQELETNLTTTTKNRDAKLKALKLDQYQSKERKLYTYFFTNPDKLKETVGEAEEKLRVLKVT